jgi:hypothetical protein
MAMNEIFKVRKRVAYDNTLFRKYSSVMTLLRVILLTACRLGQTMTLSDDVQVVGTPTVGHYDVIEKEVAVSDKFIASFNSEVFKQKKKQRYSNFFS